MSETIKCMQCGGTAICGDVHDGMVNMPSHFIPFKITGEGRKRKYRPKSSFIKGFDLTVSFACQECGYIMTYLQRLVLKDLHQHS